MRTFLVSDERCDLHSWHGHTERAERLIAVRRGLQQAGLFAEVTVATAEEAADDRLTAVHDRQLLDRIARLASFGGGQLDGDTYVTADSWQVAKLAAGAALQALRAVLSGQADNAISLMRPPGHHAGIRRAAGFCLINNVAVAARAALQQHGLTRVAIVDYDVHHGDGTQQIFYSDPQVLFISTHASPFYPGTGMAHETGDMHSAPGTTLNIPLPFAVGDRGYAAVMRELIAPALRAYRPQLILVSAGFDAHWADPLGPMALSVSGYRELNQQLFDLAAELCGGRLVYVLEGGYNLAALSACVASTVRTLRELPQGGADPLGIVRDAEPPVDDLIRQIRAVHPLLQRPAGRRER
jgi:acetoin utilization deacetylase AcuC-like enzyme